jgi:DNA polymerase-4
MSNRKIVHVDMDAFYASVEQRDDPGLRGRPVVVAWKGNRSVVCAASYEARRFGIRSAMPAISAERMCPQAIFIPPDFVRYRAVSAAVREIFKVHTDLVEPPVARRGVSRCNGKQDGPDDRNPRCHRDSQADSRRMNLTASAGVAPNKFLAKIASDWRKPNGLFVIQPAEVENFLTPLPVGRIPGVGKVTEQRLEKLGVRIVSDLRSMELDSLHQQFGRYGKRLFELARGIDESEVVSDRPTQPISAEDTFERDIVLSETESAIRRLAEKTWLAYRKDSRIARTVVLKLKTREFATLTRSFTPPTPPSSCDEFIELALLLRRRVDLSPQQKFRLVGVGLSNFRDPEGEGTRHQLFP